MKITRKQKAIRVLVFLVGFRELRIQGALAPYGMTQERLSEGHELLRRATSAALRAVTTRDTKITEQLDRFENLWFSIVRAALTRHYPDVAEWMFESLGQTRGIDLVIGVGVFLERHRELASGASPFAARGQEAVALLAERGLTVEVVGEAETILQQLEMFSPGDIDATERQRKEAEDQMWAWYLEWSTIARSVIKERGMLRTLGFLRGSSKVTTEEELSDEEDAASPPFENAAATSPAA